MLGKVILSRVALAVFTLLAVATFIFLATEILPGDVSARVLGRFATPEAKAAYRARLNLDSPLIERYALWLSRVVKGDFGDSLTGRRKVADVVIPRFTATLMLGAYGFLLYLPISIFLATISAIFRDRPIDRVITVLTLVGLAMPEFVLGTVLLFTFALVIPIFPVISRVQPSMKFFEAVHTLTLPAVTVAIVMSVYAIRMLRINLIDVLNSRFIQMSYLKGLSRARIVFRHALPNSIGPMLNVTALNLAWLIGGVVIVEQAFSYDGIGSLLVYSIHMRDAPVIQATTMLVAGIYILANLIADILSILLNPRLRTA